MDLDNVLRRKVHIDSDTLVGSGFHIEGKILRRLGQEIIVSGQQRRGEGSGKGDSATLESVNCLRGVSDH